MCVVWMCRLEIDFWFDCWFLMVFGCDDWFMGCKVCCYWRFCELGECWWLLLMVLFWLGFLFFVWLCVVKLGFGFRCFCVISGGIVIIFRFMVWMMWVGIVIGSWCVRCIVLCLLFVVGLVYVLDFLCLVCWILVLVVFIVYLLDYWDMLGCVLCS